MPIDFLFGMYAGSLAVAWLAFLIWTYRMRRPRLAGNAGYVLALETECTALETMADLHAEVNRMLSQRVSQLKARVAYLEQQIAWLLSIQPQPSMVKSI